MEIYSIVRCLAKTVKYQTLYSNFREGNITLFKNRTDYTDNQILFLNYLSFYHTINTDIAMEEIDDRVLEDEIYEDSYIHYKNKKKDKITKEKKSSPIDNKTNKTTSSNNTTWVFKKASKKVK